MDVARVAGVSTSTVSRALNGRSGVRDDLRERIEVVADSLGYSPNRAAQNLAIGQSSTVGLVVPSIELSIDPYPASLVHAMARAADGAGYNLMLFLTTAEPGGPVRSDLRGGLIDGVVISAVAVGHSWIEELLDIPVPTVLIGSHPDRTDVPVVDVENKRSVARMIHHLIDLGRRRIAIITGPLDRVDARQRLEGWRLAHSEAGLEIDPDLIIPGQFDRLSGAHSGRIAIELGVDAVFASNDELAIGAISTFENAGLRVPDDIAVAGFDGLPAHDVDSPSLSTLQQPLAELATAAIARLMGVIDGTEVAEYSTFDPKLIVGRTTVGTDSLDTGSFDTDPADTTVSTREVRPPPT